MAEKQGLYEQCVGIVKERRFVSVSFLNRILIGQKNNAEYVSIAKVIEQMEQNGVVGPIDGDGFRKILIT
ncbi:DNA translocase FtsK [Paenibacillus taichungensis]